MFRTFKAHALAVFVLASCTGGGALAHEGHHDDEAQSATMLKAAGPRLTSVGSTMELVAAGAGHRLVIYLDKTLTNEPIDQATIEVSGDGVPATTAKRLAPGTFELEADWVDQPGSKALVFAVTTADDADLLNGCGPCLKPEAAGSRRVRR